MSSLLKKRFDSSKCKTLLQLTSQRLKVLRNKQALAVKRARVDVAKLLEKNQDSNAKMQVETVFREEKILALYDLLDQFCQLVINGLESIKSQKECPLDLREAVASLIFAAPKCAELEELKQVSKHLTSKYGTDFSVAAKELRPDCGVNKQIIQSLSSRPADFDAKLKLLKAIAVENNINWDHETTIADVSKGPADLIDGPNHFASAAELSQVGTHVNTDKQSLRSKDVNEFKGQGNAVLQNAIGSHTMSVANSLGLPFHDAHQFAKINTNTGAMGSSMVSDHVIHTPVLDPYALARAEGKMDYKAVSDYMKRAQSMELKQENRAGVAYRKITTQLPEREQGNSVFFDASHCEDALQKSKGKDAKKRRDMMNAHRRDEKEMLELTNVAEYAFASANHAVEAARAAVSMVRMESLERSRDSKSVNVNKLQEMQLESGSGLLALDENYKLSGMDSKHFLDRHRLSCEDEGEPHQHNGMVGDQVSEANSRYTWDTSEDSFKYVVFEQTSGSQKYTHSSTQAEGYNKNSESYAFPEVWNEPTLYSRKNSDRIIFDTEYEESGSKELPTHALFDSFGSDSMKEQELDKKASSSNNEERIFNHTEVGQDKHVQSDLSVPQFDDYSSDEDDNVQENLSAPQAEDHISEEANDEEEPFYLRGRAAMATEDYANVTARAPYSKANMLMSTVSFSTDDELEEESSTNMRSSKQEASVHIGLSVEPLGVSTDKEKPFINSSAQYDVDEGSQKSSFDDYEELESFPTQSSKIPLRGQISTKSTSESSIMSPVAYKDSSAKPMTRRKLKLLSSTSEEWDLDASSVKLSSPKEYRDPSSQVDRKLNWLSGASEDSESMSERSFDSHKIDSPKPSFNMEDSTKMVDAVQVPQPSTRKSYYGVSKRSVRSTRSRQNQDVRSLSSGNEDIISP